MLGTGLAFTQRRPIKVTPSSLIHNPTSPTRTGMLLCTISRGFQSAKQTPLLGLHRKLLNRVNIMKDKYFSGPWRGHLGTMVPQAISYKLSSLWDSPCVVCDYRHHYTPHFRGSEALKVNCIAQAEENASEWHCTMTETIRTTIYVCE